MLKSFRIITIFMIILMLLMPVFVQATDINMNLTSDVPQTTSVDNTSMQDTSTTNQAPLAQQQTTTDTLAPTETNYSTTSSTVSTLNQLPEAGLGLTNVVNIILIVIGVLLILLGIAILIRLKH